MRLTAHAPWYIYNQRQTPLRLKIQKVCKDVVTNRRANLIQEFAGGLNSKVSGDFMETENKEICESSTFLWRWRSWSDKRPCNLEWNCYKKIFFFCGW